MIRLKEKAFWIAAGDVAGRGLSFAASIYLARTLGSEFFGLISVGISVLGYATLVSDLGLNNIGIREAAKKPEKRIYRLVEIFGLKSILGVLTFLSSFLIISLVDLQTTERIVLLGYLFSILPYMIMMEWFYSGKQEFGKIALSKFLNGFVYLILIVFMVQSMKDVALVPILYTIGVCVASLLLGTFALRDKAFSLPWRGFSLFPDLLRSSLILGIGKFFAQIVQLLPALLIGIFLSFHDAGLYGAAFRIVLIAMMADRIFVGLLLPNLASQWSEDRKAAGRKLNIVYRFVLIGGTLIALFISVSAEQIIEIIYGSAYIESALLLQILCILIAFTFINSLFSFGLIATGHDKEYFVATSIGGSISAVLIASSAFLGSAVLVTASVALSEVIITISACFQFNKILKLSYIKPALMCFILAVILFISFKFSPLMPILNAVFASILFLVIILNLNILSRNHQHWLKDKLFA